MIHKYVLIYSYEGKVLFKYFKPESKDESLLSKSDNKKKKFVIENIKYSVFDRNNEFI